MSRVAFRLVAAQAADAASFACFYVLIGAGVHQERNPLILGLMAAGGVQAVVLAKVAVAALIARRHDRARDLSRRYLIARTIAMSAATASGIVGASFNVAAIVSSR